eukprot:TRINITY_DN6391_c0_g1_i1.p1 TRINITY_DN6391_c0_g1~~TRINITY_DN6391_c0_g1_i1.p1  ORF type:complete len:386 (-),score=96.67 TRINITY_DN6391_c0_g1_i1:40-1197(-)
MVKLRVLAALCFCTALAILASRAALVSAWGPPLGWIDNPCAFLEEAPLRLLSAARVHAAALAYLIYPLTHSPNYGYDSFACAKGWLDPRNAKAVAAYAVIAFAAVYALVRRRWRLLQLIVWGVANYLPAANLIFRVGSPFADRLLYLPSVPFCILVAFVLAQLPKKLRFASLGAAAMLASVWAYTVLARVPMWQTPNSLWSAAAAQLPHNVLALHNAGIECEKLGDYRCAAEMFGRAFEQYDIGRAAFAPVKTEQKQQKRMQSRHERVGSADRERKELLELSMRAMDELQRAAPDAVWRDVVSLALVKAKSGKARTAAGLLNNVARSRCLRDTGREEAVWEALVALQVELRDYRDAYWTAHAARELFPENDSFNRTTTLLAPSAL